MWYVCRHPERCEGLYLISPAGTEDTTREGFQYDPYSYRTNDYSSKVSDRASVDSAIRNLESATPAHPLEVAKNLPYCLVRRISRYELRTTIIPHWQKFYKYDFIEAASRYFALCV